MFLTATTHNPLSAEYINEVWTDHFHPAYTETDEHRAVTSHYGRHRFTTYWEVKEGLARELVQYLRGDTVAGDQPQRDAVDDYIHTYYEDIEDCYRDRIFALGL